MEVSVALQGYWLSITRPVSQLRRNHSQRKYDCQREDQRFP